MPIPFDRRKSKCVLVHVYMSASVYLAVRVRV